MTTNHPHPTVVTPPDPEQVHHEVEVYEHDGQYRTRCLDCDWHGPLRPVRWDAIGDAVVHEDGDLR